MWTISLLPLSVLQLLVASPLSFLALWYFSIVEIGYTTFRALESLSQRLLVVYTLSTLLDSFLRLSILISLGLSYFWGPWVGRYSLAISTYAQGNNVDWFVVLIQAIAGILGGAAMGGFFNWLTTREVKKKNDAEAKKSDAEADRIKSDTFLHEFDKLADTLKEMVRVRDIEIANRGAVIAQDDLIKRHMRNALDYLRDQAMPFIPIAVSVSYEIESGKRQRPYSRSGDDITETH